jgi:type III restriction enzyme
MDFLYKKLDSGSEFNSIIDNTEIPSNIINNLNSNFELRPYQNKAFSRFIYFFNNNFDSKQNKPYQLMFNMATGSGKTLMMSGLILYLYEKGYRKFLFFVNSKNIINKTIDNFINTNSSKFLFNHTITFDSKRVNIKQVDNFEDANSNDINICFTTIQKLHSDIYSEKENSLTIEDFKEQKIVFISDEAHHINTKTLTQTSIDSLAKPSWENTVNRIFDQNLDNILLEFTATLDYEHKNIVEKYKPRVIFRYDLRQFKDEKYSKDVNLLRSDLSDNDRILQAVILNQYKQDIALKNGINLKPVILFKAQKLIAESLENKANFHRIIENLSESQLQNIKEHSTVAIIQKAFTFFSENNISFAQLNSKLQRNFAESNCISVNEENLEKTSLNKGDRIQLIEQQFVLNSLEDINNPIRAIFAVNKLNEGWDVLNLFDIVRLYNTRDSKDGNAGKTTMAEAQLIGRGARYFPFKINIDQDKYKRKYDKPNHDNELKVIEELHYHTIEDSKYISELKKALIETGIYDDDNEFVERQLKIKEEFKSTDFFKKTVVFENEKKVNKYDNVKSFADLGITKKNIEFKLHSGSGKVTEAFETTETKNEVSYDQKDIKVSEISIHIVKNAIAKNEFYQFSTLKKYFKSVKSIADFITNTEYLGSLAITFKGTKDRLTEISNLDYLLALNELLKAIENEIKGNLHDYFATDDFKIITFIKDKFTDVELKIGKNDERAKTQSDFVKDKVWYAYNDNFGTSEEKKFVEMFARRVEKLHSDYESIYLIRNERQVKVFDKKGRRFEPDFLLFVKQKAKDNITYQMFIEPKGAHLKEHDKWKEEFLLDIRERFAKKTIDYNSDKYRLTGVPFYTNKTENEFITAFEESLK